jgi:glycerol-3-phosphate dehydrogenase (NAD(P)+)
MSDGGWGTALAIQLTANGHDVLLWGPFADYIDTMRGARENTRFLKGVPLPEGLGLTADIRQAVAHAELFTLAAPVPYARGCLEQMRDSGFDPDQPVVSVAKGIEVGTLKRVSEICGEVLGRHHYAALSGPSHAEEVARGTPTAVVTASADPELAITVQQVFMSDTFRVYTNDDVTGVEIGGALKNVLAIAAGICDGMGCGDNTKAALLTRGIAEMARFGQAMGGRPETFAGLSGVGDIIVTCTSGHSRNRFVGEELGKGRSLDDITTEMGLVVAEGVKTSESAYALARRLGVETPIIDEVYAGLYEDKDVRQGVDDLMTRRARAERDR